MATALTHPHFPPAAAGRIAASLLNRHSPHVIAEAVEVLVDVLDLIGGDADLEGDPLNEDEPAFDRASREIANRHGEGAGDPVSGDAEPAAWIERIDQTKAALPLACLPHSIDALGNLDDAEEDSEDCGCFEDEPMFDRPNCERLSAMCGDGPGGGSLLDGDYGHDGT